MALHREQTKKIYVGDRSVGGGSPISLQSMTNTLTTDVEGTVSQILGLEKAGCDIVRVSTPDENSVMALREIKKRIQIPVIADIHFDHKLAIGAMEAGADGIRINPGNIGGKDKLKVVAHVAMEKGVPIR